MITPTQDEDCCGKNRCRIAKGMEQDERAEGFRFGKNETVSICAHQRSTGGKDRVRPESTQRVQKRYDRYRTGALNKPSLQKIPERKIYFQPRRNSYTRFNGSDSLVSGGIDIRSSGMVNSCALMIESQATRIKRTGNNRRMRFIGLFVLGFGPAAQ